MDAVTADLLASLRTALQQPSAGITPIEVLREARDQASALLQAYEDRQETSLQDIQRAIQELGKVVASRPPRSTDPERKFIRRQIDSYVERLAMAISNAIIHSKLPSPVDLRRRET